MPKARKFTTDQLLNSLRIRGPVLAKRFLRPESDLKFLIYRAVNGNTFRAFRNLQRRPSEIFREWVRVKFTARTITELSRVRTQQDFDKFHLRLAAHLENYWLTEGKKPMGFGPTSKLPALVMKSVARWSGLTVDDRKRLVQLLPVPLDSYSLLAIKECAASGRYGASFRIPSNATMGFIDSKILYMRVQDLVRSLAAEAGVPPIWIDLIAWDGSHSA